MHYVIGNWKAHKNIEEAESWLREFTSYNLGIIPQDLTVILCPSDPFLSLCHETLSPHNIHIGAQNISALATEQDTGETTAAQLGHIAEYVIVGHSERRTNFNETDDILAQKVEHARANNLKVIYCVRSEEDVIPQDVQIIAYEPVQAIGTGNNATVADVLAMKAKLSLPNGSAFIYGGSVSAQNVSEYLKEDQIQGVLPGTASLNAHEFYTLIQNAISSTR